MYEYDYYLDQTSEEDKRKAGAAMQRIVPWLDELSLSRKAVTWIKTYFSQGCVRKEGFFYQGFQNSESMLTWLKQGRKVFLRNQIYR